MTDSQKGWGIDANADPDLAAHSTAALIDSVCRRPPTEEKLTLLPRLEYAVLSRKIRSIPPREIRATSTTPTPCRRSKWEWFRVASSRSDRNLSAIYRCNSFIAIMPITQLVLLASAWRVA